MKIIAQYVNKLLSIWITWLLLFLDLLGLIVFLISYFEQDFSLPKWSFWIFVVFTILAFISANIKLFSELQTKIGSLEQSIAEIKQINPLIEIELLKTKLIHINKSPINGPNQAVNQYGFDKSAIPKWAQIKASMNIKNLGQETGYLVWEIDKEISSIPSIFNVEQIENGCFVKGLGPISPRSQAIVELNINLIISKKFQDFKGFAETLFNESDYRIGFRYKTKGLEGIYKPEVIMIEGNLTGYKEALIGYWNQREYSEILQELQKN